MTATATLTPNEARHAAGLHRLCECGCGESIEHLRASARYATDACRARAWKRRSGYRDLRAGRSRVGTAAKQRARRPDLRISYRKAVAAVAAEIEHLTEGAAHAGIARELAEDALQRCLTARQREVLDAGAGA